MIDNWVRQYQGDPEFEFDLLAIEVGERIVERMEELGMTRTELAAAVGVSKARISQILSGNDNLTLKSLVAVAVGLESRIELRLKKNKSESTISRRNGELVEPSVINEAAGERPAPAGSLTPSQ